MNPVRQYVSIAGLMLVCGMGGCGKATAPFVPAGMNLSPARTTACTWLHQRFHELQGWHLNGIATLPDTSPNSGDEAWATGSAQYPPLTPIVVRYNGKKWLLRDLPRASKTSNEATGISVLSQNDIWVVGASDNGTVNEPLTEHYDGKAWRIVASPSINGGGLLQYVAAFAPNDVWATGQRTAGQKSEPLREHWDGKRWTATLGNLKPPLRGSVSFSGAPVLLDAKTGEIAAPVTQRGRNELRAYVAFGTAANGSWRLVQLGARGSKLDVIGGLAVDAHGTLVAVGYSETSSSYSSVGKAWVETFDGRDFTNERIPASAARPAAAAFSDSGDLVVVGSSGPYSNYSAWAMGRINGTWSALPLPKHTAGGFMSIANVPRSSDFWTDGNPRTPVGKPYVWKLSCR